MVSVHHQGCVCVPFRRSNTHARTHTHTHTHRHTHTFNSPFSGTTQVSRHQKQETVSGSGISCRGPYASLHLAPDREPHQHPTTVFTGRVPSLSPNQQRHITEGISTEGINFGAVNSQYIIFTARRCYASAGTSYRPVSVSVSVSVCLSVCHKSEFYRNGWTNRAGFGMGASFDPSYALL